MTDPTIIDLAAGARPRRGEAPGVTAESVSTVPRGTSAAGTPSPAAEGVAPHDARLRPDQRPDITAGPGRGDVGSDGGS